MMELPRLVLASGSPRRAEILAAVGWEFLKDIPDIDESQRERESPDDYVQRLAAAKAEAVSANHPGELILGADTTVVIDGKMIGKPVDTDDARRMIAMLAGNWHQVLTGIAIVKDLKTATALERTRVRFAEMSDGEIEFLVEKGEPLDKAGAYAVQAQAALFIRGIEGDYWNVVGLPVRLVYELVKNSALSL